MIKRIYVKSDSVGHNKDLCIGHNASLLFLAVYYCEPFDFVPTVTLSETK
jgi:hypothetical protein